MLRSTDISVPTPYSRATAKRLLARVPSIVESIPEESELDLAEEQQLHLQQEEQEEKQSVDQPQLDLTRDTVAEANQDQTASAAQFQSVFTPQQVAAAIIMIRATDITRPTPFKRVTATWAPSKTIETVTEEDDEEQEEIEDDNVPILAPLDSLINNAPADDFVAAESLTGDNDQVVTKPAINENYAAEVAAEDEEEAGELSGYSKYSRTILEMIRLAMADILNEANNNTIVQEFVPTAIEKSVEVGHSSSNEERQDDEVCIDQENNYTATDAFVTCEASNTSAAELETLADEAVERLDEAEVEMKEDSCMVTKTEYPQDTTYPTQHNANNNRNYNSWSWSRVSRRVSESFVALKEGMRRRSSDSFNSQSTRNASVDGQSMIKENGDKQSAPVQRMNVTYHRGVNNHTGRRWTRKNRGILRTNEYLTITRVHSDQPKFELKLENCTVRDCRDPLAVQVVSNVAPAEFKQRTKKPVGVCVTMQCSTAAEKARLRRTLVDAAQQAFVNMVLAA